MLNRSRGAAHPRSRGENLAWSSIACTARGSSPLTRGKRVACAGLRRCVGLIPAHAGKTRRPVRSRSSSRAHPRSRGENVLAISSKRSGSGSSPLTRGKHGADRGPGVQPGLIPAHAGKTDGWTSSESRTAAHPRSRGENFRGMSVALLGGGSSPLTRGKRHGDGRVFIPAGLIPAHAGKTLPDLRFYRADRSDLGKP